MQQQFFISGSCVISSGTVLKNGIEIFSDSAETDPVEWLHHAYKSLGISYPKFYKMDSLSKLGWLCTELLVKQEAGGLHDVIETPDPATVAVLLCNSSSSLDTDLRYYETVSQMPSPALFVYTLPNIVIGEICIRHGWKGENAFFVREAFDADFFHEQVSYLLSDANNTTCICGWVELFAGNYKAAMFAVEKTGTTHSANFTTENINRIFNTVGHKTAVPVT